MSVDLAVDRVTLEMGEARTLAYSFMHHQREKGVEAARDWLGKALLVSMKRYGGAEARARIREYMTTVRVEEMCK
jgi:hypothetical protein